MDNKRSIIGRMMISYIAAIILLVGALVVTGNAQRYQRMLVSPRAANSIAVSRFGGRIYRPTNLVMLRGRPAYIVHVRSRGINRRVVVSAYSGRILRSINVTTPRQRNFNMR